MSRYLVNPCREVREVSNATMSLRLKGGRLQQAWFVQKLFENGNTKQWYEWRRVEDVGPDAPDWEVIP